MLGLALISLPLNPAFGSHLKALDLWTDHLDVIFRSIIVQTMHRQTLFQIPRAAATTRRGFCSTAALRTLPSVKQPHTLDKPGKDEHNPQTENMKKSRDERAKTSDTSKGKKPEGRNAGIGFQVCH